MIKIIVNIFETKRNWQVIFDKYKDLSTHRYSNELTPNITFQPNQIFVRNNLFEKVIKSCMATNLQFLKLKEKIGLCIYEEICDEKEFIVMPEKVFIQHDVENEKLRNENEKLETRNEKVEMRNEKVETRNEKRETRNEKVEMRNENKQFKRKNILKEEPEVIKSLNWIDKNKFKGILAIIDSSEFDYKNRIGEFKYIKIKDLFNNIRNNAINEIDAKKRLNTLKEIRNAEIKYKRLIPKQKELLNLFNDLLD